MKIKRAITFSDLFLFLRCTQHEKWDICFQTRRRLNTAPLQKNKLAPLPTTPDSLLRFGPLSLNLACVFCGCWIFQSLTQFVNVNKFKHHLSDLCFLIQNLLRLKLQEVKPGPPAFVHRKRKKANKGYLPDNEVDLQNWGKSARSGHYFMNLFTLKKTFFLLNTPKFEWRRRVRHLNLPHCTSLLLFETFCELFHFYICQLFFPSSLL